MASGIQSLLRKFKNLTNERLESDKIIKNYKYDLSIDMAIDSSLQLGQDYTLDIPIYSPKLKDFVTEKDTRAWSDIPVEDNLSNFLGNGYLNNVFNAEECNEEWLINLYMLDTIRYNFITNGNVNIKSLHIGKISHLSSYHHYIFNGTTPELVNPEWQWLHVIFPYEKNKHLMKKYKNNLLQLLEFNIYSPNNLNYIINEITNKFSKINFLTINYSDVNDINNSDNTSGTTYDKDNKLSNTDVSKIYVSYGALIIKLLDTNGIVLIKIPNSCDWDTKFINVLLMYCLLFNEIYMFKFDLITNSTYLLCKGKKKIANETMYKKFIFFILRGSGNIFLENIFQSDAVKLWLENIYNIVITNTVSRDIKFNTILDIINKSLKVNTDVFL